MAKLNISLTYSEGETTGHAIVSCIASGQAADIKPIFDKLQAAIGPLAVEAGEMEEAGGG